jgi:hypothetical protein
MPRGADQSTSTAAHDESETSRERLLRQPCCSLPKPTLYLKGPVVLPASEVTGYGFRCLGPWNRSLSFGGDATGRPWNCSTGHARSHSAALPWARLAASTRRSRVLGLKPWLRTKAQLRKYVRYNVSRCAGRNPASRMMRRNSSSVVQLETPAARTTFSSNITDPTSLPPKRNPS